MKVYCCVATHSSYEVPQQAKQGSHGVAWSKKEGEKNDANDTCISWPPKVQIMFFTRRRMDCKNCSMNVKLKYKKKVENGFNNEFKPSNCKFTHWNSTTDNRSLQGYLLGWRSCQESYEDALPKVGIEEPGKGCRGLSSELSQWHCKIPYNKLDQKNTCVKQYSHLLGNAMQWTFSVE